MGHHQDLNKGPHQQQQETNERPPLIDDLVGSSNEADIMVDGVQTSALFDTVSAVSTISQEFLEQHLPHIELQQTSY